MSLDASMRRFVSDLHLFRDSIIRNNHPHHHLGLGTTNPSKASDVFSCCSIVRFLRSKMGSCCSRTGGGSPSRPAELSTPKQQSLASSRSRNTDRSSELGSSPRNSGGFANKTRYSRHELLQRSRQILQRHRSVLKIDAIMLASVAMVESSGDPRAYRYERHLGEASTGLTQVLTSTAQWLAKDLGYNAYGVPDEKDLYDPDIALYFGAAYLTWLSNYQGKKQTEEFVIRGFNGGPNGIGLKSTQRYWEKYLKAKREMKEVQQSNATNGRDGKFVPGAEGVVHIVKQGDTLWAISRQYGVSLETLIALNPSINPQMLSIGQVVRIS